MGRSILDFTHEDDARRSVEWTDSRSGGNALAPLVKRYVRPDGSTVEAQVTTAVIEPESSEPYFFSQVQDVTERRRAERQKQVIADLGRRAAWGADVVALIGEAMRLVRGILGTTNCVTTRRLASGEVRVVAADGDCHGFTVGPGERSRTDHTLQVAEPVLSDDLSRETRFSVPSVALENGMRRGLSVPVPERSGGGHVIIAHGPATSASVHDRTTHGSWRPWLT